MMYLLEQQMHFYILFIVSTLFEIPVKASLNDDMWDCFSFTMEYWNAF